MTKARIYPIYITVYKEIAGYAIWRMNIPH